MPRAVHCNCYHILHSSAEEHATASRMAQEAHDIAVRGFRGPCMMTRAMRRSRRMTRQFLTIKQLLIFTTTLFQILDLAAVDRFFDGVDDMLRFIRRLKQGYMIIKYSDLVKRIGECMILYDWDFFKIAEYLLLSKSERRHCINIMDIEASSLEEAAKMYFSI